MSENRTRAMVRPLTGQFRNSYDSDNTTFVSLVSQGKEPFMV